ncbi:LOW QUALITY PROTEIN: nose resistant to fluoxetine protein 6-like [Drosophila rhopaloa]|uniref:Nose resistant-to-fluoxetine protein N-terminal domain-containing protein n=1 Tax=Drosophila rhopaloa TaxID=1041015 RepID=A0ABM5J7V0_DRORH|nr:LOW QUALITY PROTEIN: nose resistant to fluoxetine protein 6-like [Drosophila rhopaloa]
MVKLISFILLSGLVLIRGEQFEDESILKEFQNLKKLKPLGLEFADYFQNVTLNDLSLFDSNLPTQEDLLCLSEMGQLMLALRSGQFWALKMIDSWGSIPSGLFTGNVYDLGNFDECINIKNNNIRGKYCFLEAYPSKMLGSESAIGSFLKTKTATCFPSSCSATHMNKFVGQIIQRLFNVSIPSTAMSISDSTCQTSEKEPWNALTILTIVILALMGTIVALFTLYDYFLCKSQGDLPVIVKVFSARANSRACFRIVQNKSNPNVIHCLNGIRGMSLFWVIFLHQYASLFYSPNINRFSILPVTFIFHITLDSFFFIGGLLVSLIALRLMDRTKGKLNVPMMYLRRLLRIVPILAMAILVYTQLTGLLGDGPLFKGGYNGKASCEKSWYLTMLFVVNFANDMCLDHTWYLAVDMQLFLISPLLLFALYKWGKKAAAGIFVLIVLLSGCLFAEMMVNNYSILNLDLTLQKKMYFYTHTHAAPWLIGFLFGYFLYLSKGKKFQLSWFSVWTGWILSLALLFTSIFALYPAVMSGIPKATTLELSLYYTLTRVGWPMAIGWVVFACMQGYGSLANSFLSSPLWQPISKLSYSAYIWHSFIQEINQRITRTNTYFSDYQVMLDFWSTLGLTLLFSYLMYLIIEAPIGGLDLLLRPQKKAPAEIKTVTDSDLGKENRIDDGDSTKQGDLEATELNTQTAAD